MGTREPTYTSCCLSLCVFVDGLDRRAYRERRSLWDTRGSFDKADRGGSKQHFSQGTRQRPRRETQVEINEQYIEAVGDIEEEEGR